MNTGAPSPKASKHRPPGFYSIFNKLSNNHFAHFAVAVANDVDTLHRFGKFLTIDVVIFNRGSIIVGNDIVDARVFNSIIIYRHGKHHAASATLTFSTVMLLTCLLGSMLIADSKSMKL